MLQREHRLHQPRRPRRRVQVADVGLERPDRAEAARVGVGAERLGERRHLHRIAQLGAAPVPFHVADRRRVHVRHGERLADHRGLSFHARRGEGDLGGAVVVDRRAADDGAHRVAVAEGVLEALEAHHRHAAPHLRPGRAFVEGAAVPVRRHDPARRVQVAGVLGDLDGGAAGQRHVALAPQERLHGEVHRHEPGRAPGLHAERGAAQVELVRHARGEEVLAVRQRRAELADGGQ
jgi:hypothetical protein